MRHYVTVQLLALILLCGGCASKATIIMTGARHPATVKELVIVYPAPPPRSEQIGIITARAGGKSQKTQDVAIEKLKAKAGEVGANGIVIQNVNQKTGFIFYGGWFIPTDEVSISGTAIFVDF